MSSTITPRGHGDSSAGAPSAEQQWLNAEEMDAWLALIRVVTRLPLELDRQLQRDAHLSHFEYQVLAGLSQAPERTLTMSRLADFAEGQLPRLSQVVARLEKRGWITRRPDPADGRATLATLTDEGMATIVDIAPGHVATVRAKVFAPLTSAQVRQLASICTRIGQQLGQC